jgi:hypothetical protein
MMAMALGDEIHRSIVVQKQQHLNTLEAMQRPGLPVKTPVVRVVLRFSLLSLPRVAVRVSISDDCTAPCWRCTATRFIGRRVGVKEQWAVNGGRILDIDRFMN